MSCAPSETGRREPTLPAAERRLVLEVYEPPHHQTKLVVREPDDQTIEETIRGLSWSDITFVVLKADEQNWIEGSGSHKDDFSARFARGGREYVSQGRPTLEEIAELLKSYRAGDGRWERMLTWQ